MSAIMRGITVVVLVGMAAGCVQPPAETPTQSQTGGGGTVTLRDDGCRYEGLPEMPAGTVSITFINETGIDDQFDIDAWLLDDGHTYEELVAHIDEERRRAEAGEAPLGHPEFATLVAEATADGNFGELAFPAEPGTYGIACVLFGESGGIWAAGPLIVTAE